MDPADALSIPATVRPPTPEDAAAVVEVFNACAMEIRGRPGFSLEELSSDWRTPGFDLAADARVVTTPDGHVLGYGDLWGKSHGLVRLISWVRVRPDHRGKGIGTFLDRWVEARARTLLHRATEGARVVLHTFAPAEDGAARDLLVAEGMQELRRSWRMEIELDPEPPEPRWPEGIEVRPFRDGDERELYAAHREAFRDHHGHVESPFEEGFERWWLWMRESPPHDPSLWFLAEDGDRIAGYALADPKTAEDPWTGWVESMGVLRPWRRRGLGTALVRHALGALRERGARRAGLSVDATSLTGATRLYSGVGFRTTEEDVLYEKELRPGRDLSTQSIEG